MELRLERIALRSEYTIGKLYVDGEYVCDTIEDTVRDLDKDGKFANGEVKIPGKTAIPYGRYEITMKVKSPKYSNFSKYSWAKKYDGYLPRLLNVSQFDGVLMHVGNSAMNSEGCIIVGENKVVGKVINSVNTFRRLMDEYLVPAKKRNENIVITII